MDLRSSLSTHGALLKARIDLWSLSALVPKAYRNDSARAVAAEVGSRVCTLKSELAHLSKILHRQVMRIKTQRIYGKTTTCARPQSLDLRKVN